mgnify:FL=1
MSDEQQKLLPIGSRVTHWDGGPNTWGKGTIIAYNQVEPSSYLKTNFSEAVEMANEVGLLGGVLGMLYDRTRCPYVVQWDIRVGDSEFDKEKREKYPRGYRDVYEHDSVRAYPNEESTLSIFPDDWTRVMGRIWLSDEGAWAPWLKMTEELYLTRKDNKSVQEEWQFCVRPLPIPRHRYSPTDGSFVPLSIPGSPTFDLNGYYPPIAIFVEFHTHDDSEPKYGVTASLCLKDGRDDCSTVFIVVEPDKRKVFSAHQVSKWRELIQRDKFTPALMEFVGRPPEDFEKAALAELTLVEAK